MRSDFNTYKHIHINLRHWKKTISQNPMSEFVTSELCNFFCNPNFLELDICIPFVFTRQKLIFEFAFSQCRRKIAFWIFCHLWWHCGFQYNIQLYAEKRRNSQYALYTRKTTRIMIYWLFFHPTYPSIVEISTSANCQSCFRLHRVRQRNLKLIILTILTFINKYLIVS